MVDDRRDRLLAGLTLIAGIALLLGLPFALKAGAEFFLPVTIALVIAIALIPVLEWLERRRLPSWIAALVCVLSFLALANVALAAIVVPAIEFFRRLPERIDRIQANLAPLLDLYATLEKYLNRTITHLANTGPVKAPATAAVAPPGSLLELAATSAPTAIIQVLFGVLVVFFFLAGWTRTRRKTITSRASFGGAMATARVIQDVVDDVSAYLGTITLINLVLGAIVGTALWMIGMPYPAMWGGIVALLNYVPYFGPIVAALSRAEQGQKPIAPVAGKTIAWNFLNMLRGKEPTAEEEKLFDTALVLHADHELNASAFTCRVVASTTSDYYSSIVAGILTSF